MKKSVKFFAALVGILYAVSSVNPVHAAGMEDIFNAQYYALANPDVAAEVGGDATALYNHFIYVGSLEGRSASPLFDVKAYINANPDLKERYGDNYIGYYQHFMANGAENRETGAIFNAAAYAAAYPDVAAVVGVDPTALFNHFLTVGLAEGKTEGFTLSKNPEIAREQAKTITAVVRAKMSAMGVSAEQLTASVAAVSKNIVKSNPAAATTNSSVSASTGTTTTTTTESKSHHSDSGKNNKKQEVSNPGNMAKVTAVTIDNVDISGVTVSVTGTGGASMDDYFAGLEIKFYHSAEQDFTFFPSVWAQTGSAKAYDTITKNGDTYTATISYDPQKTGLRNGDSIIVFAESSLGNVKSAGKSFKVEMGGATQVIFSIDLAGGSVNGSVENPGFTVEKSDSEQTYTLPESYTNALEKEGYTFDHWDIWCQESQSGTISVSEGNVNSFVIPANIAGIVRIKAVWTEVPAPEGVPAVASFAMLNVNEDTEANVAAESNNQPVVVAPVVGNNEQSAVAAPVVENNEQPEVETPVVEENNEQPADETPTETVE